MWYENVYSVLEKKKIRVGSFAERDGHLLRTLRRAGLFHVLRKGVINPDAVRFLFPSNALKFCIDCL